jgi:hypothetical protein
MNKITLQEVGEIRKALRASVPKKIKLRSDYLSTLLRDYFLSGKSLDISIDVYNALSLGHATKSEILKALE